MATPHNLPRRLMAGIISLVVFASSLPANAREPQPQPGSVPAAEKTLFTLSAETTRVMGPLRKDGRVDYVEVINQRSSRGVTPANNAVVLLLKAVGPGDIEPELREEYFRRLGIDPLPIQGNYFVTLDHLVRRAVVGKDVSEAQFAKLDPLLRRRVFVAQEKVQEQYWRALNEPWTAQQFPLLAEWLLVNRVPLELARQASEKAHYYAPSIAIDKKVPLISVLLPSLSMYRDMAAALVLRMTLNTGQGKLEQVLEDSVVCHRLGRLVGRGPFLVDSLVGVAIDSMACEADVVVAHYAKLTTAQVSTWRRQLRGLPAFAPVVNRVEGSERFTYLEVTMSVILFGPGTLANLEGEETDKGTLKTVFSKVMLNAACDWDDVLRRGNRWYDELVAVARKPTYDERRKGFAELDRKLEEAAKSFRDSKSLVSSLLTDSENSGTLVSKVMSSILASMLLPSVGKAIMVEDRLVMQHHLVEVALALAAYRSETRQYPVQLEQLVPGYLDKIPVDLFVGKSVRYRRKSQGYLLYSVGPDQKDDGGPELDSGRDDIGFQLPVPAEE